MMQTTHALVGATTALPVATVYPELASVILVAGLLGGAFPDLDLYYNHRRTLHYPVLYPAATLLGVITVSVLPTPATIAATTFLVAATMHCWMDILGGGVELRPWEQQSEKGVYNHITGSWIAPRRWIRYDGSPEDFVIAVTAALPVLLFTTPPFTHLAIGLLTVSLVYVVLRRRLADIAAYIATRVPESLQKYTPSRYFE